MFRIFDIVGSALSAQSVRLNTTASNLANANSVAGSEAEAYRAREPVFQTVLDQQQGASFKASVRVAGIVESQAPVQKRYEPGHPLADAQGYVYRSNVNPVEEMANMMSASRSYQTNVEVFNTAKELLLRTLSMGR